MSGPTKPTDSKGRPGPVPREPTRKDAFVARPSSPEQPALTGAGRAVTAKATEVAPEVSQGPWRERAFMPRGVMAPEEIVAALTDGLSKALVAPTLFQAWELLRSAWIPVLRQALEQGGGDGIDAWLQTTLKPPGRSALDPFFAACVEALAKVRGAQSPQELKTHGDVLIGRVKEAVGAPKKRKLSFKQMERELEGKLEVDELLMIAASLDDELTRRLEELDGVLGQLREQIRSRPGLRPDGMYSNYARFKAEARVLNAERARRVGPPPILGPPPAK